MTTLSAVGFLLATGSLLLGVLVQLTSSKHKIARNRLYVGAAVFGFATLVVDLASEEVTSAKQDHLGETAERTENLAVGISDKVGGIGSDVAGIKASLLDKQRENASRLRTRYPFGYFVFGPTDSGYVHLEMQQTRAGLTVEFPSQWDQPGYKAINGKAHIDLSLLTFGFRRGKSSLWGIGLPLKFEIPLVAGAEREANEVLADNVHCVVEVLDADPTAPVFVFGFREGPEPVPDDSIGVGLRI